MSSILSRPQWVNPSIAAPVYIRNTSRAITVTADVLAPNGARHTICTVLAKNLSMLPKKFLFLIMIVNALLRGRRYHPRDWLDLAKSHCSWMVVKHVLTRPAVNIVVNKPDQIDILIFVCNLSVSARQWCNDYFPTLNKFRSVHGYGLLYFTRHIF